MRKGYLKRRLIVVAVLAIAVWGMWWLNVGRNGGRPPCTPEHHVVKDASGKVVRIENKTCL